MEPCCVGVLFNDTIYCLVTGGMPTSLKQNFSFNGPSELLLSQTLNSTEI